MASSPTIAAASGPASSSSGGGGGTTLLLDPDIRDWVLLPLFVIMIATGLLRHYSGVLMSSSKQKSKPIPQRTQSLLRQATKIRSGASHYLPTYRWYVRKQHYAQLLRDEADWVEAEVRRREELGGEDGEGDGDGDDDPMSAMMGNPMGMMKGNMAFMVQNMVMMQGIQHFFSGFILLKMPFPLTVGFKNMFQRGLAELPDLESSYVSSVSWYFLVMYGLRSFFRLAIGDPPLEIREQEMLSQQYGMQNPPPPQSKANDPAAIAKQLRQEAENMDLFLHDHKSEMDAVEKRLLGKQRYPKKKLTAGAAGKDDFFLTGGGGSGSSSKKKASNKKRQ